MNGAACPLLTPPVRLLRSPRYADRRARAVDDTWHAEATLRSPDREPELDAVIVGGGPAGLSAALWLARYRRRVRVFDAGEPRNAVTDAVHGFPGIPEAPPAEFRRRIRDQAIAAGADVRTGYVVDMEGHKDRFLVRLRDGAPVRCKRVLLAYGRRDEIPDIPGLDEAYGTSVHHCPDCDGPTIADEPAGVIGVDRQAAGLALFLLTWTERVTLFLDGRPARLSDQSRGVLRSHGIAVRHEKIDRIRHHAGQMEAVDLAGAEPVPIRHLFFHLDTPPSTSLGERIGCAAGEYGDLVVDAGQETTVPGVYAAGDIAGHPYLSVSAAAEGVKAALSIHRSLLPSEFELESP